ncbi:prephenate dehydrogenase [Rhodococcus ruber Chol-4]|uniref:Bifunctional chorismate mutase/ prephenate dehydrogenase n=2 Tax=Rhodococcus ruber TaxID=1830 RepID=A0A098BF92_9NOCA|nr:MULTISPECIES: prephenate dehydrogenase dimerization domain-containing protein [Rhodococcus]MDO2381726.1 prephenate dehydrogenase/arogenate dehydrogenase family protein [Rhodococcus ruber]RIK09508.1 MAG: prephenate dehydrogenase/arogenate dehydrogenase family protein [Acidobacteriota bacterium]ATQ27913.1 prephenate dehydrogenase/arogenate dehydrogenase family protein [Rhodococcus ruber]AUM15111.1 prephenate dehydrogenase/arogenate dehydrogenase family protein [Rhodococcus ruber]AWG99297.1 pr
MSDTTGLVVVAGGAGAVGRMLGEALRRDGADVLVVDPAAGDDPGALRDDVTVPTAAVRDAVRCASMLVLAVPEATALAAAARLGPLLSPDAVLVETLSVKSAWAQAGRGRGWSAQCVGLNPMFAPALGMAGRPVAVVEHRPGPAVDALLAALDRWGARVVRMTADDHDRVAAATQAATHAAVLAFGLALGRLGVPPSVAAATAPPPHVLLRALLARIAGGAPEVYLDVQAGNPHAAAARSALRASLDELEAVVETGSVAGFADLLGRAATPLGADTGRYRELCAELFAELTHEETESRHGRA